MAPGRRRIAIGSGSVILLTACSADTVGVVSIGRGVNRYPRRLPGNAGVSRLLAGVLSLACMTSGCAAKSARGNASSPTRHPASQAMPASRPSVSSRPTPARSIHRVEADDGHRLRVIEKSAPSPTGTLVLVHGRTWSSIPNFDLPVPRASLMDRWAQLGLRVLAIDMRGYGGTKRDASGVLTPDRAAADVAAVLRWARRPGESPPVLLGYSMGSLVSHLVAQRFGDALAGVVLYGHPRSADFEWSSVVSGPPARQSTTVEAAREDFIASGHRPEVVAAYAEVATKTDPVRMDWSALAQFKAIDPARITRPVLVLYGDQDPFATAADLGSLQKRLGARDGRRVVLEDADHAAHLLMPERFCRIVAEFAAEAARDPS